MGWGVPFWGLDIFIRRKPYIIREAYIMRRKPYIISPQAIYHFILGEKAGQIRLAGSPLPLFLSAKKKLGKKMLERIFGTQTQALPRTLPKEPFEKGSSGRFLNFETDSVWWDIFIRRKPYIIREAYIMRRKPYIISP